MRSKSARRRARRLGAFIENVDKRVLYAQHEGICGICKAPVPYERMTIDHVVPLAKGGLHSYRNTQPAHEDCNIAKGSMLPEDYERPIFRHKQLHYLNQPALT